MSFNYPGLSTAFFSPVLAHVELDLLNKPILNLSCVALG